MADTYAIIETGGKQYRVEQGLSFLVERLPEDEGSKVSLRPVMFRGAGKVLVTSDELAKVKVEATVTEHLRGPKIKIFKKKPKKGYVLRAGHRQGLTKLEITGIKSGAAAAKKAPAKKADETATPAAAAKPAAKKPAAGKPAAKKPAAKKAEAAAPKEDA